MRSRKGFTLIELLVVIAIIAILAAILFPVFMRAKAAAMASHCQSSMNQIGKSMKMYLSDWEDTYPTNRFNFPLNSFIAQTVPLSNPAKTDTKTGEPIRFESGVNWVEGLYPYTEKVSEGDASSAWKCPNAKTLTQNGNFAQVTYSFNINLVEMPEGIVKNAGAMLMCRELDRLHNSVLKPTTLTPTSNPAPQYTFLNSSDNVPAPVKYKMHGDGSDVLFADGHVKSFPSTYFPATPQWATDPGQWFNYVSGLPADDPRLRSIAITP